jgi:hypothetical protein
MGEAEKITKGEQKQATGERRKEGEDNKHPIKFLIPQKLLTTIQNYA